MTRIAAVLVAVRSLVVACALCGCGRIGFRPLVGDGGANGMDGADASDATALDTITLAVRGAVYTDFWGAPVAGAYVYVEHPGGATELDRTDANGSATITTAEPVNVHVVYAGDAALTVWEVISYVAVPPGIALELGGLPHSSPSGELQLAAPNAGTAAYALSPPERCAPSQSGSTNSFTVDYRIGCDGETVRALVFGTDAVGNPSTFIDEPGLVLSDGLAQQLSGSYTPISSQHLAGGNGPPGTTQFRVVAATAPDGAYDDVESLYGVVTAPPLDVMTPFPAIVGSVFIEANGASVPQGDSFWFGPATQASTITADTTHLLPLDITGTVDHAALALDVTGSRGEADRLALFVLFHVPQEVDWYIYAPADATTLAYPALPAAIPVPAVTAATSWNSNGGLSLVDVVGSDGSGILPVIDTELPFWGSGFAFMPPAGVAVTINSIDPS